MATETSPLGPSARGKHQAETQRSHGQEWCQLQTGPSQQAEGAGRAKRKTGSTSGEPWARPCFGVRPRRAINCAGEGPFLQGEQPGQGSKGKWGQTSTCFV